MVAGKLMLMALVACGLFVNSLEAVGDSELGPIVDRPAYARNLLLKEQRLSAVHQLFDYADFMDCPDGDLIACMRSSQHIMTKVFECVGIMMDMGEAISTAEGLIKNSEDFVKSKVEELEYQADASASWTDSSPRYTAVNQVLESEVRSFLKMLRNLAALDDELKRKISGMYLKMVITKRRTLVHLVDYVRAIEFKEGEELAFIANNPHVIERVGDVVRLAKLEGEMKALKEGRVKDAQDFVRGAIEGLEETKRHQLKGSTGSNEDEQKLVDVFAQVLQKELEQSIKFLRSLL